MNDANSIMPVSELNRRVRLSIEREFPLLWVTGEVSNLTRATSGHLYFSLKDDGAQARCVMFRSRAQTIPWRLENGQQIEVRALVTLYEARGDFQLVVDGMRRAGLGKLFEAFARLKERLELEGLFSTERKKPIPRFPRAIGIVSSPKAAALQDVLAAIGRRAPHLTTILYPTAVQGDGAAANIAEAIRTAGIRNDVDVLLIVRGGGSIEDLWSFNEEIVARALAECPLPTVSGIGHETDVTIADFAADLRAATPTAAAELASQGWQEGAADVGALERTLVRALAHKLANTQQLLDHLSSRLVHPAMRLHIAAESLRLIASRLAASISAHLAKQNSRLQHDAFELSRKTPRMDGRNNGIDLLRQRLVANFGRQHTNRMAGVDRMGDALNHLNPEAILARGFSVVRDENGNIVTDATSLAAGDGIYLRLANGEVDATVLASRTT